MKKSSKAKPVKSRPAKPKAAEYKLAKSNPDARAQTPHAIGDDDDEPPKDIHEFRRALARKIMTLIGLHRRCREPLCRRLKRCAGADLRCQRDFPGPPVTPEQQARVMAGIQIALKRRMAEKGW